MQLHFEQIIPSIPFLLAGTLVTLKYVVFSLFCGSLLGILLSLVKISHIKLLRVLADAYTSIFRGTPLLVQLTLVYYATPQMIGYTFTPFQAGLIAFSLNSAAYVSEVNLGGIQAVDKGQFEAAQSLGIPYFLTMRDIVLPQAIKNSLPGLINEAIDLLKESTLVSIFGELDLLRRANIVSARNLFILNRLFLLQPFITCLFYYYHNWLDS